jgi:hypothetical protein
MLHLKNQKMNEIKDGKGMAEFLGILSEGCGGEGKRSRDTRHTIRLNVMQLRGITGYSKAECHGAESDTGAGEAELAAEYVRSSD